MHKTKYIEPLIIQKKLSTPELHITKMSKKPLLIVKPCP